MTKLSKCTKSNLFKAPLVSGAYFSSVNEFPVLRRTDFLPRRAVPFDKAFLCTDTQQWVHFYMHDRNFERVWNTPERYLEVLKKYDGVITPDFSLYRNLPLAIQIWNTYRNRALAYWLQNNGVNIVPNISWGDERTYAFAFEGIEQGGTVATSTNGCLRNKINRYYFAKGLAEMVKCLKPHSIINYSGTPEDIFGQYRQQGITVIQIENYIKTVRAHGNEERLIKADFARQSCKRPVS